MPREATLVWLLWTLKFISLTGSSKVLRIELLQESPLVLQTRIYFFGCIGVYFERFFRGLLCGLCICCGCTFRDKRFPATSKSIGPLNGKSASQLDQEIEWLRIREICARGGEDGAKVFSAKIEPSNICQGQVGDCWLMSALACLAQVDGAIQNVFYTREYTAYGKYKIRIFDKEKKSFVTVEVDDLIPVRRGTNQTMFAKPSGGEAWVLLLEKAMAKFMGSYNALDGGSTLYAFECLTGNYTFKFKLEGTPQKPIWKRYDLVHVKGQKGVMMLQPSTDELEFNEMFMTVMFYTKKRSVIAASSGAGSDKENINGIVQGHAYSVINAREVEDFQLVQLRNPWGTFEWQGNWSDRSPLWRQFPKVAKAVDFSPSNDGTFWMDFKDFCMYYKNLDFCFRTTGWNDLVLDIHEESPCCGPVKGCFSGCCTYWFCCKGCRALCFANDTQTFQRAPQGCCGQACVC